ncbi:MAG: hypothetical protein M3O02_13110 [Acidobacteriota bacterium]|nr:hypothetical protein [Acidobacteriota bacterium]
MSPIHSRRTSILLGAAFTLAMPFAARAQPAAEAQVRTAPTVDVLRREFLSPPDPAKPMVRWWWFGPAVTRPEILRELTQMKADGIGGAELAFVYAEQLDDPAQTIQNLPFLSPGMLDAVTYAQAEGRRLGLRIDVTLCSGWPYGGPATPLSEAVGRLRVAESPIPANTSAISAPNLAEGETLIAAVLAKPSSATPPAAPAPGTRGPRPVTFDPAGAEPLPFNGTTATIPPTTGARVAVFFIQSHTKQAVKRAAVGAEGFVLDPFSKQAVATHLRAVGEPLVKAFGATPPYAVFSDSLEAYGADWTPSLPAEFNKRRGYDLLPHLAELVAGGSPAADQVRHDYGQTLTELVDENYLTQINDWANTHHTRFRSQTYGEPAVDFSSQNLVALAEGEGPQWRSWSTLRWATSANHVFHHTVTSGETFTWLHSPVFRATPLDMKVEADIDFIMGENQLIFHGWPYSPPQAFYPGWSLYAAANFNDNNPWHPVMPVVTRYIARLSYLMRQGEPANQVAILLPTDDVWATFSPTHTTVTGALQPRISPLMAPILTAGYNIDYIDAKAIEHGGLGNHQLLVLPPMDRIPVATLDAIYKWRMQNPDKGARPSDRDYNVICIQRCPSIDPQGKPLPGGTGSWIVEDNVNELAKDLTSVAKPDFALTAGDDTARTQLGFIRRKLPTGDIYFVANTSPQTIDATATFGTSFKNAIAVDPDSATVWEASPTGQAIHLAPYESRVFFFSEAPVHPGAAPLARESAPAAKGSPVADLSADWKVNFVADNKTVTQPTLTDWTADPATRNYSGEAVYSRDFTLASKPATPVYLQIDGGQPLPGAPNAPPERFDPTAGPNGLPNPLVTRPGPGLHAYYDPPVREAALVTINGQPAGALWHPPYRLDVSRFLKAGQNHIEIHVYNTALNHWAALPPHDFGPLIAKYGDKFQMQDLNQVKPIPSGILGAIHLTTETK